ncbi:MAG: HAD-IIA family hydrolase [Armatimonadetes bacterium]|nr:HAD-IIA family hydrolase [Armatimonadota bacterium]
MPFKLYVLDLDGTLFRGRTPLPYAVEVVNELVAKGARIAYVTNNSGMTPSAIGNKLEAMGFPVRDQIVLNSGFGAARYLAAQGIATAFVVGEPGLHETMTSNGVKPVGVSEKFTSQAVVAGIYRSLDFAVLSAAADLIRSGVPFIATNTDATYPIENGGLIPGAGAVIAYLERASGKTATVIGKPEPILIEEAMRQAKATPAETLVVGDRYETDIESGSRAGCATHLVLTGVTQTPPKGIDFSEDLRGLLNR